MKTNQAIEPSANVASLKGSFKVPDRFDYKVELAKALGKKYLKNEP